MATAAREAVEDAPVQRRGGRRWPPRLPLPVADALRYCTLVFLGMRVGLTLLGLLSLSLVPANASTDVPGWPAPTDDGWSLAVTSWERWDALWYLRIADQGYRADDASAAFFPLYPLLVRGLAAVNGGHPLGAALVVSNVAFLAALVVVHLLTSEEFDRRTARRTVLYLALFPTALFFVAPYTESLFLLLAASTLWAARRQRWLWAGVFGAAAAATRSAGVLLALPVAIEAVRVGWAGSGAHRWRRLAAGVGGAALVPVGLAAYLGWWHVAAGDALRPFSSQGGWLREFSLPWETLAAGAREGVRFLGVYPGGFAQTDLVLVAVALAAAVWVARRTPPMYAVWTLSALVLPLLLVFGGRPFMSLPRFVLPLFPLFWALARFADRYRAHDAVVAFCAAGLGAFTLLFVNWYFVF